MKKAIVLYLLIPVLLNIALIVWAVFIVEPEPMKCFPMPVTWSDLPVLVCQ